MYGKDFLFEFVVRLFPTIPTPFSNSTWSLHKAFSLLTKTSHLCLVIGPVNLITRSGVSCLISHRPLHVGSIVTEPTKRLEFWSDRLLHREA